MRKLILTLALVLAFTVPAWAGPLLKVNGSLYVADTIVKNGVTYVPIRFVAEKMGADVGYDAQSNAVIIDGTTGVSNNVLKRPSIYGDDYFVSMVNQALDLLEARDTLHYYLICDNVAEINLNKDMAADRQGYVTAYCYPNRIVSLTERFANDKNLFNPTFIAGVLAHEATHAMQFRYFTFFDKNAQEVEAYNSQNLALIQLGAPSWMVEEVKKMNDTYLQ